jgi:carbon-monoxide dehydrogenase medium subunit
MTATLQGLYRPTSVEEAVALLARDESARPLAGGATLVAMLNARVLEPQALVSLSRIAEIQGISALADGGIRIGAFTRHAFTASSELLRGAAGVVRHAASQIANETVRHMGTIGGSIAFADPGLDYPPALVAAEAVVEVASTAGRRRVPAREFFVDWYTTALAPGELVTAVFLPPPRPGGAGLYVKHARVSGDYATASVGACAFGDGRIGVAVGACGPTPLVDDEANRWLSEDLGDATIARASARLVERADPLDDVRGSADYRRLLIPGLVQRAMRSLQAMRKGQR